MGHVVHDGGGDLLLIHELADGGHGLLVQYHALAEDDKLRAIALDELLGLLHVHLIGVVGADGEVHHGGLFRHGVDGDVVVQRTHGLGGQVATLDDVVVHHIAKALGLHLAVEAVLPVHQGGEHRHVGHLAAEGTGLHLGAAEVGPHFLHQQLLHPVDELSALIVEDVLIIEGQHLLMLGVAAAGVAAGQDANGAAGGILGGDQVDALLLPPLVILQRLRQQLQCLGGTVAAAHLVFLLLHAVDEGTGVGRCGHAHVTGGDDGLQALAADVHLYLVVLQNVAVDVAQADGALAAGLQNDGLKSLTLALEVGHHGAAGDPAHMLAVLVDLHTGTHDAAIQQGDGRDLPGQDAQVAEIAIHMLDEGLMLLFQRGAADEVALLGGKADGKLGQGNGENGDHAAVRGSAHLVAVQGQRGLQTQGVAGPQTGGTCAQFDETVPQPCRVFAGDIDLIAQRLAGVAGLGHAGGVTLQRDGAQRVLHGFGQLCAAGHLGQHFLALGALYRDGGHLAGDVLNLAVEALQRLIQMGQILVGVGGVHHQQIAVLLKEVQIGVVHRAAVVVGNDAVLGHVQIQGADVAGQHMLQKRLAFRPGDLQPAHVGHVEQAAHLTGVQMLGNDAAGVLDGHLPSAEVHQLRAGGHMDVIQLGTLQFAHLLFPP